MSKITIYDGNGKPIDGVRSDLYSNETVTVSNDVCVQCTFVDGTKRVVEALTPSDIVARIARLQHAYNVIMAKEEYRMKEEGEYDGDEY